MKKQYCANELDCLNVQEDGELLFSYFNQVEQYQVLLNKQFEIKAYNHFAESFTKKYLELDLQKGKSITAYINHSFTEDFCILCNEALKEQMVHYEHYIQDLQGKSLWFDFSINPLFDFTKNIIGFAITGNNVSRQKNFEKTIRHQSESLSVIAQLQSHLVRQPVSSILGILNLVKEDNFDCRKEYFEGLETATKQLDDVIQRIVKESRK